MLVFVWEHEFDENLMAIEPCSLCADRLMRRVEASFPRMRNKEVGYSTIRLRWKSHWFVVWYLATGCMITLLSLQYACVASNT